MIMSILRILVGTGSYVHSRIGWLGHVESNGNGDCVPPCQKLQVAKHFKLPHPVRAQRAFGGQSADEAQSRRKLQAPPISAQYRSLSRLARHAQPWAAQGYKTAVKPKVDATVHTDVGKGVGGAGALVGNFVGGTVGILVGKLVVGGVVGVLVGKLVVGGTVGKVVGDVVVGGMVGRSVGTIVGIRARLLRTGVLVGVEPFSLPFFLMRIISARALGSALSTSRPLLSIGKKVKSVDSSAASKLAAVSAAAATKPMSSSVSASETRCIVDGEGSTKK